MEWIAGTFTLANIIITSICGYIGTRKLQQFDRISYEHQIRFSNLHQKRAEVIAEIYQKLVLTEMKFNAMTVRLICELDPTPEERGAELDQAKAALITYYQTHRLYLEKPLCKKIDLFLNALHTGISSHAWWSAAQEVSDDSRSLYKSVEQVKELMPEIRDEIEAEFRTILGVNYKVS